MRTGILLVSILLLLHVSLVFSTQCVDCTVAGKVWCPQTRECVIVRDNCPLLDPLSISWFSSKGSCFLDPISLPSRCPNMEVNFDSRLPPMSVLSGNQIMIPVQPRILVDDVYQNQTYDVGGYFSFIPSNAKQTPQFFFFSKAIDNFATLDYIPYNIVQPDEYSQHATQVIQLLDMTVVGNTNAKYEIVFIVSRHNRSDENGCVFTPPLVFKQTPTLNDFTFTLGVIGIVVWLLGTFVLLNFMLYFNKKEEEETAKLPNSLILESPQKSESGKRTFKQKFRSYLGLLANEGRKFISSFTITDQEFLTNYGVTVYHYIWFHRMALVYIFICSVVALVLGMPTDLVFGKQRDSIAGDFATTTIASLEMDSKANLVHFFILVVNVSFAIGFVWRLRKFSFAVVMADEQKTIPAQEFAVEIQGFPKEIVDEQTLLRHFASIYGDKQVISAHIPLVYGNRWKLEKLKKEKAKLEKQYEETHVRPLMFQHFWHAYSTKNKIDAINYYDERIAQSSSKLQIIPSSGSSFAYVTFADLDTVRNCLKNNNHSTRWYIYKKITGWFNNQEVKFKSNPHHAAIHSRELRAQQWHVKPAPLPSEIIWPNLELSNLTRMILGYLCLLFEIVVLTCVLSVTLGFAMIEISRDLVLSDLYYKMGGETMLKTIANLTLVVLPEAVAIIEEIVAPIVESVEEHAGHVHKSGWRKTVMWHTAFFELMSGIVISRIIYILVGVAVLYYSEAPFDSYHYLFNKTGMDMMKYICIKTFTVYGIKYPVLCLAKIIQARFTGKLERPDFDYFDLYAQKIIVMFCVLTYGSVMPLILPLGFGFLGISFLYDRWAIVSFHKKDVIQDSKLLFYASDIFVFWPSLAAVLVAFSFMVGIVMLETRKWQYRNQAVKGVRKIIKAGDPFAKKKSTQHPSHVITIRESGKETEEYEAWDDLEIDPSGGADLLSTMRTVKGGEEDILRVAFAHPLSSVYY